jgi:hypothetical protein
MADAALRERYARVLERLDAACAAAGRSRSDVTLIAVSKLHPAGDVAVLAGAGQVDFGENYVQEALRKRDELAADPVAAAVCAQVRWHMIGHVQSRKAPLVAGAFCCIHTLDSRRLADALERRMAALDARQPVLFEVNVGEEAQKAGVLPADLPELADYVHGHCPHLEVRGLMCLPPVFDAGDAARPHFARLRALRDDLRGRLGLPLPELSMGMSGDFAGAVAEGATMVRIGTDIFGPRPPRGGATAA